MKPLILLILVFGTFSAEYSEYLDRRCGSDMSNLWLDVVVLMDNSAFLSGGGLVEVQTNILDIFSDGTKFGTDPKNPKTTRIGLVAYNQKAQVVADLDAIQSFDDLEETIFTMGTSKTYDSYLGKGLEMAGDLFTSGAHTANRTHYRKVIIIKDFRPKFDPVDVADRLKADDVTIITIALETQTSGEFNWELGQVATPRFNFSNFHEEDLLDNIRGALSQANCFCPNEYLQYRTNFSDENSYQFGTCLNYLSLSASWTAARFACRHLRNNSFLVSEMDKFKHAFVFNLVNASSDPSAYFIGLNLIKGVWRWDQPPGWVQPVLDGWNGWDNGYPVASSSRPAVINEIRGIGSVWQNIGTTSTFGGYVCEVAACDTDNYCGPDDVN